jgi:hypothetical protein
MVRCRCVSVTLLANLFGVGSFGVARGRGEVTQTWTRGKNGWEKEKKKGRMLLIEQT